VTGPAAWRRVLPATVGLLLVACAALVIIGLTIERGSSPHVETGVVEPTQHSESAEGTQAETGDEQPPVNTAHSESAEGEAVLGVPIESPVALAGLAVVSVALAALVWRRATRPVTGVVIVFTVAAGALDVAEISRQLSGDRVGLAVLAGLIALLRVATVTGATVLWRAAPTHTAAAG
jgi:hypothetical protein